jgi:hypothetical protein
MIKEFLDNRIKDLQISIISQDIETTTIQRGRIDTLYWVKNGNNEVKTNDEIKLKIQRYKEELLCLPEKDLWYREKTARIKELENVLNKTGNDRKI